MSGVNEEPNGMMPSSGDERNDEKDGGIDPEKEGENWSLSSRAVVNIFKRYFIQVHRLPAIVSEFIVGLNIGP